jgi:hypothetical protein
MIEMFLNATDFENIFENNLDEESIRDNEKNNQTYWERVFANATTDAHKLFKS